MATWQKLLQVVISSTLLLAFAASAQTTGIHSHRGTQQGSSGITWAMQAMLALTGGNPVNSVTESGSVTRTLGGDQEDGSITLQSSGIMTNQISISTSVGTRSETRTWQNNYPAGGWTGLDGTQHPMKLHNCWTDAVWFFPALSLLADYADPNLVFTDLGPQQYQGGSVEHIQVYRTASGLNPTELRLLARLSTVDYYLDSQTALPVAIAFNTHADSDLSVDIPVMIIFSNYQSINGIKVPFQVVEALNGTPMLQISITNATPNG